jgi:hypothetical protein
MDRHVGIAMARKALMCSIFTPQSHSSSPSSRRWTSKPMPMRTGGRVSPPPDRWHRSLCARSRRPATSATAHGPAPPGHRRRLGRVRPAWCAARMSL